MVNLVLLELVALDGTVIRKSDALFTRYTPPSACSKRHKYLSGIDSPPEVKFTPSTLPLVSNTVYNAGSCEVSYNRKRWRRLASPSFVDSIVYHLYSVEVLVSGATVRLEAVGVCAYALSTITADNNINADSNSFFISIVCLLEFILFDIFPHEYNRPQPLSVIAHFCFS